MRDALAWRERVHSFSERLNPIAGRTMPALALPFSEATPTTRHQDISSCAHPPAAAKPGHLALWDAGIDPDVRAAAERTQDQFAEQKITAWDRDNLPLDAVFEKYLRPDRERRVALGTLRKPTFDKDRQALRRFLKVTTPDNWARWKPWPGVMLPFITPRYLDSAYAKLASDFAPATVSSTISHISQIFRDLTAKGGFPTVPHPTAHLRLPQTRPEIYSEQQQEQIFRALTPWPELQIAFVAALTTGLRSRDLFRLEWQHVRLDDAPPVVLITATKTSKLQGIPIVAPLAVQLGRLMPGRGETPVFPRLTSHVSNDPQRSRAARRRNQTVRMALSAIGINFRCLWHPCRAAFNTRLENHRPGLGQFVLGHGLTLNARHYYDPAPAVIEGMNSVAWPAWMSESAEAVSPQRLLF